jgi:hypothetical protein
VIRFAWAWLTGNLMRCPVCGRWFDWNNPGGNVLIEGWPTSNISMGTCKRCPGQWFDADYVYHPPGTDQTQVNSKPYVRPTREIPTSLKPYVTENP